MSDAFLSYSRKDSEFVHQLHDALISSDCEVWVDWADIMLTADWWQEICLGIDRAHTFICIISPDSMTSPICNLEINYAVQNNKRLMPIVRRETDINDVLQFFTDYDLDTNTQTMLGGRDVATLAQENWKVLARHNWLLFDDDSNFGENFQRLIEAIDTDLEHVKLHTRLLIQAREWEKRSRNDSFLLVGDALREIEKWLEITSQNRLQPTELQLQYIVASHQRGRQRQRIIMISASIALGIMIGLTSLSVIMFGQAVTSLHHSNATEHSLETQIFHLIVTHTAYALDAESGDNENLVFTPEPATP